MLSMHDLEDYCFEALKAGACGYVLKTAADREMVEACRSAMRGEPFLSPPAVRALMRAYLADPASVSENVLAKLGMRDRVELTRWAIRHRLVEPDGLGSLILIAGLLMLASLLAVGSSASRTGVPAALARRAACPLAVAPAVPQLDGTSVICGVRDWADVDTAAVGAWLAGALDLPLTLTHVLPPAVGRDAPPPARSTARGTTTLPPTRCSRRSPRPSAAARFSGCTAGPPARCSRARRWPRTPACSWSAGRSAAVWAPRSPDPRRPT